MASIAGNPIKYKFQYKSVEDRKLRDIIQNIEIKINELDTRLSDIETRVFKCEFRLTAGGL